MKNVVVIGGGHGSSIVLSGLKDKNVNLSAVISMADDGGSTGRLRRELGVSAMGDIRNCLAALSTKPELAKLFSQRFASGDQAGHALGNLFLAAGELESGDIQTSIDFAREALVVEANIFPATLDKCQLKYIGKDAEISGMHEIAKHQLEPKPRLLLEPKAELSPQAKSAISQADLVVIAPGNFYCSIAQALVVDGMAEALSESTAKVAMVVNLVNIDRHTPGFNPADYLDETKRLLGRQVVDCLIYNSQPIEPDKLKDGESQVEAKFTLSTKHQIILKSENLVDKTLAKPDPKDKIAYIRSNLRHDKNKLAVIIENLLA